MYICVHTYRRYGGNLRCSLSFSLCLCVRMGKHIMYMYVHNIYVHVCTCVQGLICTRMCVCDKYDMHNIYIQYNIYKQYVYKAIGMSQCCNIYTHESWRNEMTRPCHMRHVTSSYVHITSSYVHVTSSYAHESWRNEMARQCICDLTCIRIVN